ncbi:MAG TPA: phospholipid carrier-dependent glycosyltransferase, partial [Gemmatimonadaceae bacterium]|nr:phospholipid carrier-dependent glycosyltransferase [Gemmatimonadaceae bacterium]
MTPLRWVVGWGVLVVIVVEALSATRLLTAPGVATAWILIALGVAGMRARGLRPMGERAPLVGARTPFADRQSTPTAAAFVVVIAAILCVTMWLAMVAAPTAGDALSYHMARVAHWVQNRSVAFYPTNIDRQLWSNPWAEYVLVELQLLSGGDRLTNMLQWAAFAGTVPVSIKIAEMLGCNREVRLFAALFAVTIPMAIAQSTGAQVDLVAAFWLLVFIALALDDIRAPIRDQSVMRSLALGTSIGLAILAKGTNYVFILPFLAWWAVREIRISARSFLRRAVLVGISALAINATHYARNWNVYGWPLGPRGAEGVVNAATGPRVLASNLVRNAALHLGTPKDTRIPASIKFNARANDAVRVIHRWIGLDVNDTRT